MTRTDYRPRPVGLRRQIRRSRRPVATRSASLLREVLFPTRVVAWLCVGCEGWVTPEVFVPTTGMCRTCTDAFAAVGGGEVRG